MLISKFLEALEEIAPKGSALADDLPYTNKVYFGNPDQELFGVAVSWMATGEVIQKAASSGCNLLIVHEDLFYHVETEHDKVPEDKKVPNLKRKELLEKTNMVVYRIHSPWDRKERIGTLDAFISFLGWETEKRDFPWVKVCILPKARSIEELAEELKEKIGLKGIWANSSLDRKVRRVGVAVGGFGLWTYWVQTLADMGAEVIVVGETHEYVALFAKEYGIDIIEVSHSTMENVGLRKLAEEIANRFPSLNVHFVDVNPE